MAHANDNQLRLHIIAPIEGAMATHFGVKAANCYTLAEGQVTGPLAMEPRFHSIG
ncbi:MAG: hypothetical protein WD046_10255 [Paracoccaceae bacterium]